MPKIVDPDGPMPAEIAAGFKEMLGGLKPTPERIAAIEDELDRMGTTETAKAWTSRYFGERAIQQHR